MLKMDQELKCPGERRRGAEGVEAIVMTASGCGVTVKEYGHLLRHDPTYAQKAADFGIIQGYQ